MPSVQFSSAAQSCPSLCDPKNRSTPGLPVHHQLPEFTQTHVHRVGVTIQPSHPLSSPYPLAHNPSQHQSLFQWVNSSHEVAKVSALALVLPKNTQGDQHPLEWTGWISLQSKGLSRVFSNTTVQKHNASALSFLHSPNLLIAISNQMSQNNISLYPIPSIPLPSHTHLHIQTHTLFWSITCIWSASWW